MTDYLFFGFNYFKSSSSIKETVYACGVVFFCLVGLYIIYKFIDMELRKDIKVIKEANFWIYTISLSALFGFLPFLWPILLNVVFIFSPIAFMVWLVYKKVKKIKEAEESIKSII